MSSGMAPQFLFVASVAAPWGPIQLAAGETGIVAIEQLTSREAFVERLQRRFGRAPSAPDADATDAAAAAAASNLRIGIEALEAFLGGSLAALDALTLDLADRPAWDRGVLGAVRTIPPGSTASYGEVARMIGRPGAARAVGGAVGRNPIGLAIPCHRVIAGDGSLGSYGAAWWGGPAEGRALKARLLAREGVHFGAGAKP